MKCEFAVREGQLPPAHAHRAEPHTVLLGGAAAEAPAGRGRPDQAGEVPGRGRVRGAYAAVLSWFGFGFITGPCEQESLNNSALCIKL